MCTNKSKAIIIFFKNAKCPTRMTNHNILVTVTASPQTFLVNSIKKDKRKYGTYSNAFVRPTFDATIANHSTGFPENPKFSNGTNSVSRWAVVTQGPYLTV